MSISNVGSSGPLLNFAGLASGLDTNSIINALMQVEKRPQVLLQNKKSSYQSMESAYASVIGKFNALQAAARNIGNPLDWQPVAATSSDPTRATVSAASASTTGSVSFTVQSLASKDVVASFANVQATDVIASGSITIGTSAGSTSVNVGGGTIDEVVQAINGQSAVGLTAAAVQVSPGQFKLQLTANSVTDAVNTDISQFNGLGASWGQVSSAAQAHVHVGAAGIGYDVYSDSNTFIGLLPGVDVTIKQADPSTTVTVQSTSDATTMVGKVQKMVDAYNAAIDEVKRQTAYSPTTKVAAPLLGQSALRQVMTGLASAVSGSAATTPSAAGIGLDSTGHMTFDVAKFTAAYQSNPAAVQRIFADPLSGTDGLVDRLKTELEAALSPATGSLRSAQRGVVVTINDITDQIANFQYRLGEREKMLRRQFAALESALTGLHSQGAALQQRLGSYP